MTDYKIQIWYEKWYTDRYKNDLIKPHFETGLIAVKAYAESIKAELKLCEEYEFYRNGNSKQ